MWKSPRERTKQTLSVPKVYDCFPQTVVRKKIHKLDSEKWTELHKQKEECAREEHSKQSEINVQQPPKLLNVSGPGETTQN